MWWLGLFCRGASIPCVVNFYQGTARTSLRLELRNYLLLETDSDGDQHDKC